jgi:hypothetical protein
MSVRCEECNYENLPQHSFCGMCGAKLPSGRRAEARAAEKPEQGTAAKAFSRPSLLGLAGEDATEAERLTYLLQDEPGEHRGRWVAVLVVVVAVAAAGWHWRAEVRGWASRSPKDPATIQAADTSAAPPATTPAAAASPSMAPASSPEPVQQTPSGDGAGQNAATTPTSGPSDQTATQPNQPVTDAAKREVEPQEEPAQVPDASAAAAKPALKPVVADITHKAPVKNVSADALEVEGEDYLYGHGVRADCGRAGKSLLAAASQSSAKAQSMLGTMYATGHCVTRDLPAAYRWYAKASHQDPGNVRIRRDLEVLWAQMTPEEREVAMKK